MCGIAGIVNRPNTAATQELLSSMLSLIQHRGPDESGILLDGNVGMGNVRLSIIDLSTGQQPMSNPDKSLWIVYNGEVFNYLELREDLEKKGVVFTTHSDTEVVLKYYEFYGPDCLGFFNGQFAFAIWNRKSGELFLARDRVGIRPLYYYYQNGTFIFASEIKCILDHPEVKRELDMNALRETFTFWAPLSPHSSFRGIKELPPGHYLKLTAKELNTHKYWSLDFSSGFNYSISSQNQAIEELDALLEDAVKLRLRSDVPVAAYLSGGLDSSATTYYIKKIAYKNLNTFSIGFEEKEYDESQYQRLVSRYLNTHHTSFTCTNDEISSTFPDVIWHTEVPILRTAPTPMHILSRHVREYHIKVVITGEGADEMLGGYNIFKEMSIRRFWARNPESNLRPLLLKRLYPYIPQLQNQKGKMLKFFFGYKLTEIDSPIYSHLLRWNNTSKINSYLLPAPENKAIDIEERILPLLPDNFNVYSDLAKAQWLEATIFMSGYLLSSQGDRMTMANSVEGRYPFLDHRVIEFASKLHPDLKLHGLNEKYILKNIVKDRLPQEITRRSKQAYRAPIQSVFMQKKRSDYVEELLSDKKLDSFGIFDKERVKVLQEKILSGNGSEVDSMAITGILSTQLLIHQFIDQRKKAPVLTNCKIVELK